MWNEMVVLPELKRMKQDVEWLESEGELPRGTPDDMLDGVVLE